VGENLRIAVDAMGGDRAPREVVDGVVDAVREADGAIRVVLTGKREIVEKYILDQRLSTSDIEIVDAPEVIEMSESPASAIRKKHESSIAVAMRLQKEGNVDAVVGAGNTGAMVAGSLISLGRLPGIKRPAIAIYVPTRKGGTILLDGGANSDCEPNNLMQFATMGSVLAEEFLDRPNPTVGLLSIGEESSKGNELTRNSHELLARSKLSFVGNVEGRDIFEGDVDVVVTDGFVGNVILKFMESIISYMNSMIKEEMRRYPLSRLGALMMKPVFSGVRSVLNYEEYGAAPLLGVNGVVFIGHGGSSCRAIKNAVLSARRFVASGINEKIRLKVEKRAGNHGEQ
jgi:glycerol-3-phosphate acyltransferase PlsX